MNIPACEMSNLIKDLNMLGYNISFHREKLPPGAKGRKSHVRSAIIYSKQLGVYAVRSEGHTTTILIRAKQPVLITCSYVPPVVNGERSQVITTAEFVKSVNSEFPGIPHIFLGDINETTTRITFDLGRDWLDVTPLDPNFVRSNCSTRPSRVLCRNLAHMIVRDIMVHPDAYKLSDGHSVITFNLDLFPFRGLTVKSQNIPLDPDDMVKVLPVLSSERHCPQISTVTCLERKFIRDKLFAESLKSMGKLDDETVELNDVKLNMKACLDPRLSYGGPCALRVNDHVLTEFHAMETEITEYYSKIWSRREVPDIGLKSHLPEDVLKSRREQMMSEFTVSETQQAISSVRASATCSDHDLRTLKEINTRAKEGDDDAIQKISRLTEDLNKNTPRVVHCLVALLSKVPGVPSKEQLRTISCPPMWFKIFRQIICSRIKEFLGSEFGEFREENFTFRTGRSIQSVLMCIRAFFDLPESYCYAIYTGDAVKAYDYVQFNVINQILDLYGILCPATDYFRFEIFYTLVLGEGLSRAIRVLASLGQGDPLSCISFTCLADVVLRLMPSIPRCAFSALIVDDFCAIAPVRKHEEVFQALESAWGRVGIGIAKLKAISLSGDPALGRFSNSSFGRVLGGCFFRGSSPPCTCSEKFDDRVSQIVAIVKAYTPCEILRANLCRQYIGSLITFFPSRCIKLSKPQGTLCSIPRRGLFNPNYTQARGILQSQFASLASGARGIPCLSYLQSRSLLGIIRAALATDFAARAYLLKALKGATHLRDDFDMACERLQLRPSWKRPEPFPLPEELTCEFISNAKGKKIAVDASFNPDTLSGSIGFAYKDLDAIRTATIGIRGVVHSSFEAEICGVASAYCLSPKEILNDNRAVTLVAGKVPRPGDKCVGVRSFLYRMPIKPTLSWVKGHQTVEDLKTNEEAFLNDAADLAAARPTTASVSRSDFDAQRFPLEFMDENNILIGPLFHALDIKLKRDYILRLSEGIGPFFETSPSVIAFYITKGRSTLPPAVTSTILALRSRSLFKIRMKQPLRCQCSRRGNLNWTGHHIAFDCKYFKHTVTPEDLTRKLKHDLPNTPDAWWMPACLHTPCVFSKFETPLASGYSCLHQIRALAPKNISKGLQKYTTTALGIWASYINERLKICYPNQYSPAALS